MHVVEIENTFDFHDYTTCMRWSKNNPRELMLNYYDNTQQIYCIMIHAVNGVSFLF